MECMLVQDDICEKNNHFPWIPIGCQILLWKRSYGEKAQDGRDVNRHLGPVNSTSDRPVICTVSPTFTSQQPLCFLYDSLSIPLAVPQHEQFPKGSVERRPNSSLCFVHYPVLMKRVIWKNYLSLCKLVTVRRCGWGEVQQSWVGW